MTQTALVLGLLRAAGPSGICSFEVYRHGPHAYNARNRVGELEKRGFGITHDRCKHDEATPYHVRWTLTRDPEQVTWVPEEAKQLSLIA